MEVKGFVRCVCDCPACYWLFWAEWFIEVSPIGVTIPLFSVTFLIGFFESLKHICIIASDLMSEVLFALFFFWKHFEVDTKDLADLAWSPDGRVLCLWDSLLRVIPKSPFSFFSVEEFSLKMIYMLFTGWEVRIGKNCARGLKYGPRPQALWQFFPIQTDQGRWITFLFISKFYF